jgi:ribosomal protein S27E
MNNESNGRIAPRCCDCANFYVPFSEPQWKYIGTRVGECKEAGTRLRPSRGGMTGTVNTEEKLKSGGVVLVDKDFGCILFKEK